MTDSVDSDQELRSVAFDQGMSILFALRQRGVQLIVWFNTILLQIITSNGVGLQVLSTLLTALPLQHNYSSQHGNSNNIEDILQDTVNRHRYVSK